LSGALEGFDQRMLGHAKNTTGLTPETGR
jgi:hypothetical protein